MGHLVYLPAAPPECMPYTPCPACPPGAPTWGRAVKRRTKVGRAAATPHVYHYGILIKHKGVYVIFVYHYGILIKHKGVYVIFVYHKPILIKHKGVYVIFVYHLRKTTKHKGVIKRPAESKGN